jgi:hypothetical protein
MTAPSSTFKPAAMVSATLLAVLVAVLMTSGLAWAQPNGANVIVVNTTRTSRTQTAIAP